MVFDYKIPIFQAPAYLFQSRSLKYGLTERVTELMGAVDSRTHIREEIGAANPTWSSIVLVIHKLAEVDCLKLHLCISDTSLGSMYAIGRTLTVEADDICAFYMETQSELRRW